MSNNSLSLGPRTMRISCKITSRFTTFRRNSEQTQAWKKLNVSLNF